MQKFCISIRNISASFLEFVKDNNADLIAVTETWLRPEDTEGFISSITPPGYKFTHVPRNVTKGGGVGFSSRRTCVLSKFQKTIVRLLKVPRSRLALRVLKMLYFMYSTDPQIFQSRNS